jgi:hypothetical protein
VSTYPVKDFTYGAELEFADVDTTNPLPEGSSWNHMDNTIVNSNGIANDPKCELWKFGGEINTKPTSSVTKQVEVISDILRSLKPKPTINYRCNLHVHVRVPALHNDLDSCKKLLGYIDTYGEQVFDIVESIPKPNPATMTAGSFEGAMKRYHRRKKSHQYQLPKSRVHAMFNAKTTHEFHQEHAPLTDKNTRMWYFSPRAAINLRQMWETTNTIEFRHFPGTVNLFEFESCIMWCREFLNNVLNNEEPLTPIELYHSLPFKPQFPEFATYDHELEKMYQLTNFESNSRKVVASRLEEFKATGKITA